MRENSRLVLIGGGGHCKSVLDTIIRLNTYSEVVITDCKLAAGTGILGCKVVGNDEMLPELFEQGFRDAVIAIGSIKSTDMRRDAFLKAQKVGFNFPDIIDPSAVVAESASIGAGVYIGKNAAVNADTVIDDMAIINTGAIVEHDCRIGKFTHVAVGAVVCGEAEIEKDVFVGANTVIIQGVKVGMKSIIGAGSVVIRNVSPNSTVVGMGGVNDNSRNLLKFYNDKKAYPEGRYAA